MINIQKKNYLIGIIGTRVNVITPLKISKSLRIGTYLIIIVYPKSIEENLLISIEMNLSLLIENRNNFGNKKFTKENDIFYRDYITHIFGTFHKNKEIYLLKVKKI